MTDQLCRKNRFGSANSMDGKPGTGIETRHLRNAVSALQQDLLTSRAETQKVTDQLNCLITLVKR